jgi:molybdate transport system ATP-binding protein
MLDLAIRRQLGTFSLDIALQAPDSGLTALFGRSGAGKTSVIAAIAGLLRPEEGHIRVADQTLFDAARGIDLPAHRRRIGYVFQDARLFPHLTVHDNLLYGFRRAPADGTPRHSPERIIALLGIEDLLARRPGTLSGGEKQRVAIGRALLAQPRILLMDEPLAALDAPRRREILPYLERLRDELRLPIVYVSHALDEVLRLANRVAIIEGGRVAALGTPAELSLRPELRALMGEYDAGALIEARVLAADREYGLTTLAFPGGELRVPGIDAAPGSRLTLRIRARDVSIALWPPAGLSIRNVLPAIVAAIREAPGNALAEVTLDTGGSLLLARITREAVHRLGLKKGQAVHALVKSVSFEAQD